MMNHLWQSTLFVIVIWIAALALRKNGARVRCWLWTVASVKFLVPLSTLVSLGERFQWRAAPAAVQPAVSFVMQDILAPAAVVIVAPASVPQSAPVLPWILLALWALGAGVVLMSWWRPVAADPIGTTPSDAGATRRAVRCGGSRGLVISFDA